MKIRVSTDRLIVYIIAFIAIIGLSYYQESTNTSSLKGSDVSLTAQKEYIDDTDLSYNSATNVSPLIIKNTQNDDEVITYNYHLKIDSVYGAYRYTYNGEENYLVFSANGEADITLKSNESITIYDVPNEVNYSVEQTTDVSKNYQTKANDHDGTTAEGVVSLETTVLFENNTKISKEPVKKNPFTSSKSVIMFAFLGIIALALIHIMHTLNIKKFE